MGHGEVRGGAPKHGTELADLVDAGVAMPTGLLMVATILCLATAILLRNHASLTEGELLYCLFECHAKPNYQLSALQLMPCAREQMNRVLLGRLLSKRSCDYCQIHFPYSCSPFQAPCASQALRFPGSSIPLRIAFKLIM